MKNLLLLSALLLFSFSTTAQLYVTPNGTSDSYVYVNDEVLFVEQDLNLVENTNDPDTKASIYLRNDAQLIQGATASANSGDGLLSVYQDSHSDSYDYNFWGSPVGNPNLGPNGNVNFGVFRLYDPNTATQSDQTLTTAALNGIASPNLTISRRWLYKRLPGTGYQPIYNSDAVNPGLGFTMKGVGVSAPGGSPFNDAMNQTYDFRGRPNNGNISVPVLANESTLAGNPYPSALDLNLVFNDPDNVEIQEFRFWDEDRSINSHNYIDNKGGYGTWIPGPDPYVTGGVYALPMFLNYDASGNPSGGSAGSGQATERLFAPIGQGFNIFADATGDGQIIFKNSHRVFVKESAANNSEFRTPMINGQIVTFDESPTQPSTTGETVTGETNTEYPPTLRINAVFGDSHFRELVLMLWPESTDGYDRGLDARHPMDGATAEAFWPIGDDQNFEPYVIQTVPYDTGKQVPINFVIDQTTVVELSAYEEINLPSRAYLLDAATGVHQEVTGGHTANITLHPGNYDGRYYIVFRGGPALTPPPAPLTRTPEAQANVDFFQNNSIAELEVSNPEGYDIKNARIFDMSGKMVLNESNIGNSTRFSFSTATFSDGVYIVKLTTVDDITIDYKITVYNKR